MGLLFCKEIQEENKEVKEDIYEVKINKLEKEIANLYNFIKKNLNIEDNIKVKIFEDHIKNKIEELNKINNEKLEKLEKLDELEKKQKDLILNYNRFNNYLESKKKRNKW
jgi:hypothetical protein